MTKQQFFRMFIPIAQPIVGFLLLERFPKKENIQVSRLGGEDSYSAGGETGGGVTSASRRR